MSRFKHSPLFQRVLEYKKGNTAPKVQPDMALRLARRQCPLLLSASPIEFTNDRFLCIYSLHPVCETNTPS